MSVITEIIQAQAFESIRDRVAEILADELGNQLLLTGDYDLDADVFVERCIPFDKTELPAVNVSVARNALDNHNAFTSDGTNTIHIDVYHSAKSSPTIDGTSIANMRMHKLIGLCRAILEDARYLTLGFQPPFISNRHVIDLNFQDATTHDGVSSVMGRLRLSVRARELNGKLTPNLIKGYETTLKLHATDEGYYYFGGPDAQNELGFNYDLDFNL